MENKRYLHLDLLKIFASLSVVAIHIAATKFFVIDVNTFDWEILNFVYSISRYCVPVFVMITGVLLLDEKRDTSLKIMITKYLFKIIIIYIAWSSIYAIVSLIIGNVHYGTKDLLIQFIYRFIAGPTHFSYLFTISGLYLITPFIKKIVNKDKFLLEAFLVVSIVLTIVNSINKTVQSDTITMLFYRTNIDFFLGYTFYFVGGYYLLKYPVNKPVKWFIHIMGIIGLLLTMLLTSNQSRLLNTPVENFYGYLEFSVILSSFFMFQLFLDLKLFFEKNLSLDVQKIITYLSKINLSIYIIHPLFIVIFSYFGLLDINMPIVLYLIIFIPLTYVLSALAHYVYSKLLSFRH